MEWKKSISGWRVGVFLTAIAGLCAGTAHGQLLLNEGNAVGVSSDTFLDSDTGKPYEGYDYGIIPHSGNNNPPWTGSPRGNPFPADVDAGTPGNQTTLPNGWNGSTGWARIKFNGGDWMELVVSEDHTDLRGWTLYWENNDGGFGVGASPDDRGFIKFTQDPVWADLRSGTILTLSEDDSLNEIRDAYPEGPPQTNENDTGYDYDLSTDTSFNPFDGNNDWHRHFHVDESLTDAGTDTQWFKGYSDMKVDNDEWRMAIFDDTNTALAGQVEQAIPRTSLDLATGMVGEFVGESATGWGDNTGAGGVNNQEMIAYTGNPSGTSENEDYEDLDFSTFGTPNMFNVLTESTLDGVQDFSGIRNPVTNNTYDWTATGTADFATPGSWQKADDNTTPGAGPDTNWTARVMNGAGGDRVAQVTADTTVDFLTIEAASGTATVDVQSGKTLTVDGGDQPGRVLIYDGGKLKGNGTVVASEVEFFGGTVAPGASAGTLTVTGALALGAGSTTEMELDGDVDGQDLLSASGDVAVGGSLEMMFVGESDPDDLIKAGTYTLVQSTGGSLDGTFDTYTDLGVYTDDAAAVQYTGTSVTLTLDYDLLDGDAELDGDADSGDLNLLLTSYNSAGGWANGDFSGDGQVDSADLNRLLTAYNTSLQLEGSGFDGDAHETPEPSSLILLASLGACLGLCRMRFRKGDRTRLQSNA